MSTQVRSNNTVSAIIGVVAVVVILAVIGSIMGGEDSQIHPDREDQVLATFEVWWGEIIDTGDTYEDSGNPINRLECHDRELEIVIYVDGEEEVMQQHASDSETPCVFRHHRAVARGAQLRMTVREVEVYGWKMATIHVEGHMALPNGMAVSPDDRPIEVWGLAL